jgi:TetR/AcrR family transcriptional regulator
MARATRDRILDAALVAWGTRGYEATSLDALAASLGLAKQSILYWFPSKDALLEAVIQRSASELAEAM